MNNNPLNEKKLTDDQMSDVVGGKNILNRPTDSCVEHRIVSYNYACDCDKFRKDDSVPSQGSPTEHICGNCKCMYYDPDENLYFCSVSELDNVHH